jgi:group II intron reverse transcriptase/maturase
VDGQALEEFEAGLEGNLYKIWNRMSSGSYFPPPVRAVEIPKPHSPGVRVLGVPTVADRIAQTATAMYLEPLVEPRFHQDSYGYRPGRSQLDALAACRRRCWKYDWIIDLDVQKFFDTVPWRLVVRAVRAVTDCPWVLLYVKRWLAAPLQRPDGTLVERSEGTPQGSAISPVLANLFMHFAFDLWMARAFPGCPFERYADDAVVHCRTRGQAEQVLAGIAARMGEVGLRLHPDKTRIVYCKDSNRREEHEHISLGRVEARCRRYRRSVSSTRPPNRTCPFLSIRLSTGHAVADRAADFMRWRCPVGWWPVLFRHSPPTVRGFGGRDSDIGSLAPRRATRASCLRGWSNCAPNIVA